MVYTPFLKSTMVNKCGSIAATAAPDSLGEFGAVTDTAGDPGEKLTSAQKQGHGQRNDQPGKEYGEGVKHCERLLSFPGAFQKTLLHRLRGSRLKGLCRFPPIPSRDPLRWKKK